jgi:cytochrome oxidase Cu insertion factor (SCO1/SenC/PrrC family)
MVSKLFPAILIAVVIWLAVLVWRDSGEGLRKLNEGSGAPAPMVPASARPNASDFTLVSVQGTPVQLASFKGKSPVVLDFFATW